MNCEIARHIAADGDIEGPSNTTPSPTGIPPLVVISPIALHGRHRRARSEAKEYGNAQAKHQSVDPGPITDLSPRYWSGGGWGAGGDQVTATVDAKSAVANIDR